MASKTLITTDSESCSPPTAEGRTEIDQPMPKSEDPDIGREHVFRDAEPADDPHALLSVACALLRQPVRFVHDPLNSLVGEFRRPPLHGIHIRRIGSSPLRG